MQCFSLQIQRADDGRYQWRIRHRSSSSDGRCSPFLHSLPVFPSFLAAFDAGGVMLARACGEIGAVAGDDTGPAAPGLYIDCSPSAADCADCW